MTDREYKDLQLMAKARDAGYLATYKKKPSLTYLKRGYNGSWKTIWRNLTKEIRY